MSTSLTNHFKLSLDKCPKKNTKVNYISKIHYVSFVNCLMYAMICIRLYLVHVVSRVCMFRYKLGKRHQEAVKSIFGT